MVTCQLQGGVGNQMFQIAATIGLALDNNTDYGIPTSLHNDTKRKIMFHHFPSAYEKDIKYIYKESHFHYDSIPYKEGICLSGYFQSEKYFISHRKKIIDSFNIPYDRKNDIVSIHVRRTDYLLLQEYHPVIAMDYINKAIDFFTCKEYRNFLVFSDDISWCKENITSSSYPRCNFAYSEGKNEIEDMSLMSGCEHNIIANSSFSWWAAWLNQNPNKIVIAPKIWFGKNVAHNTKDLIPDQWIKI